MTKDNNKITLKQNEFLKEYFKTGNATRSALKVYNTDNYKSASVIASENLEKLRNHYSALMEAKGLCMGKLIDVILNCLEATTGGLNRPDHKTRLKAVEITSKWLGLESDSNKTYPSEKNQEMKIDFISHADQGGKSDE